jgi:nicotinamidase-related amidase
MAPRHAGCIMPVTCVDERSALIMIDLQKGILRLLPANLAAQLVTDARQLAAAFRARSLPVVAVNVAYAADLADAPAGRVDVPPFRGPFSSDWSELADELDLQSSDLRVTKHQWNAFHGTDLDLNLRRRQVTELVVVGVATSRGVESTVRSAYEYGYNVVVPSDAIADPHMISHQHSRDIVLPQVAELGLTSEILALLERT